MCVWGCGQSGTKETGTSGLGPARVLSQVTFSSAGVSRLPDSWTHSSDAQRSLTELSDAGGSGVRASVGVNVDPRLRVRPGKQCVPARKDAETDGAWLPLGSSFVCWTQSSPQARAEGPVQHFSCCCSKESSFPGVSVRSDWVSDADLVPSDREADQ